MAWWTPCPTAASPCQPSRAAKPDPGSAGLPGYQRPTDHTFRMDPIADSDHRGLEDTGIDPRAERAERRGGPLGGCRSGRVPWTAWAGFGSSWLSAPDSYWRRRFLILASGLAVLCMITWGVSDLLGPAQPIGEAGAAQAANKRLTLPPAAYGPPSTPSPGAAASSTVPPTPILDTASTSGTAGPVPAGSASATLASPGQSPSAAGIAPGQCPPASIVLSLFSAQPKYSPAQQPRFTVYVVSTAPGTCRLPYQPPFAHVIVTRNGEVVWDSASCPATGVTSDAPQKMPLSEGVPKVTSLSWNRKATSPGCAGSLPAGASGTFDVVAMAGGKSSPVAAITLTRK